jgi:hypothetical protein
MKTAEANKRRKEERKDQMLRQPDLSNSVSISMTCKACAAALPDLLLDPAARVNDAARAHLANCNACARQYAALESTMHLLDSWRAPAVSPYFDQRLAVRLREEQASPAPGWFEQLRTRLLFNTGRQFRPALAGAMALLLIAGGGGVGLSTYNHQQAQATQTSAVVKDLQILDRNEQALQQMDELMQDASAKDNAPPQS